MPDPFADADPFPDRNMAHLDKVSWMIETAGWAMESVEPDRSRTPPRAPYAYTVGLVATYEYPEVVVFGMTPANAHGLLGLVVGLLQSGVEPPIGEEFVGMLDNEMRCALLHVPEEQYRDLFPTAVNWYRSAFDVVQLTWPDRNGFLPYEPGFDQQLRFAQPVIGQY